ncbi:phenazine biosynthesis PhzF protein, partial [Sphaerosporella brunnea]
VFTNTPFEGNPLAIVNGGPLGAVTDAQMQTIAREFNFSETVIYHTPFENGNVNIRIFTTTEELQLAGHPVIGSGFYFLSGLSSLEIPSRDFALLTRAGRVPAVKTEAGLIRVRIPQAYMSHPALDLPEVKHIQTNLKPEDYATDLLPVVSIVKGMNFFLLELTSEDALARMVPFPTPPKVPEGYLGEWYMGAPMHVSSFFVAQEGNGDESVTKVRTRMFFGKAQEDPATGSAACALSIYLAKRISKKLGKGAATWRFELLQGVEMGRLSEIHVAVGLNEQQDVEKVELMGSAVKVMEGHLQV